MASFIVETLVFAASMCVQFLKAFVQILFPPPRKDINGEIIFLTGAGSGIGRLMAFKFARLGATVVCVDINQSANDETVREIQLQGGKAHGYKCDCSKRKDIYRVADLVRTELGDVTILINNAGIVSGKKFLETEDSLIQKTMKVNTMAHFWTTKAFLPSMLDKNHGHVVTIASSAGLFGASGLCDYCASKFGAVGFDESLHMELGVLKKDGIHTTVVCPYFINTGLFHGATTRFPRLLPILEPGWVTNEIVDGVLRNKRLIFLPKIMYFFVWLKGTVPSSTYHSLVDFFGGNASMESFQGRAKKIQ